MIALQGVIIALLLVAASLSRPPGTRHGLASICGLIPVGLAFWAVTSIVWLVILRRWSPGSARPGQPDEPLIGQAGDITALNEVAAIINASLNLQEVLDLSLRSALRAIGWEAGAIYMWDEKSAVLNLVSYAGFIEDQVRESLLLAPGQGAAGQAAQTRAPVVMIESSDISTAASEVPRSNQVTIPLMTVPGDLVGVLEARTSAHEPIRPAQLAFLTTIAHQIAGAITKAQLYVDAHRHARELERIVDARTQELAQVVDELRVAVSQAQEAERLKSLLLSTVSHELRTPLATIKGSASMLREHYHQLAADLLQQHLCDIEEEADKLTELISNLLEMSRIEAGILHIQPQIIDLGATLQRAVSAAQKRLVNHPVSLEIEGNLVPCQGDARRVEQIVANLLDNAAKYSPAGMPIVVRATHQDRQLLVSVADRGAGIAPEHQLHIFDRFYQIDQNPDRGRHGIGLGLAICRGLVEALGGGIWVDSMLGEGSTFTFSLPAATVGASQEGRYADEKANDSHS